MARAGAAPETVRTVRYPLETLPRWTVSTSAGGYEVDDATGAVSPAENAPGAARYMRQLHDGHEYNAVWQTIIFIGGLAPLALGITGVIMWLRTRDWRRRVALKRQAA